MKLTAFTLSMDSALGDERRTLYVGNCRFYNVEPRDADPIWEAYAHWRHRPDMERLSRDYPGVLFTLDGEGEEPFDVWREWYRGGRRIGRWDAEVQAPPDEPPQEAE